MSNDKNVNCVMVWLNDSLYSFLKRVADECGVSPGYFIRWVVEIASNMEYAKDEK